MNRAKVTGEYLFKIFDIYTKQIKEIYREVNRDSPEGLLMDLTKENPYADKKITKQETLSRFNWYEELDLNVVSPCPHCFAPMLKSDLDMNVDTAKIEDTKFYWTPFHKNHDVEDFEKDNILPMHPWCALKMYKKTA